MFALYVSTPGCPYGLMLPPKHEWVKEFRDNVSWLKPADINVKVQSNCVGRPVSGAEAFSKS